MNEKNHVALQEMYFGWEINTNNIKSNLDIKLFCEVDKLTLYITLRKNRRRHRCQQFLPTGIHNRISFSVLENPQSNPHKQYKAGSH